MQLELRESGGRDRFIPATLTRSSSRQRLGNCGVGSIEDLEMNVHRALEVIDVEVAAGGK